MTAAARSEAEALLARVRELAPGFRERAGAAEAARRLPQESVRELLDAGLARVLAPRALGGWELGLEAWFAVVCEIAAADASHGWCASLIVHHSHWLGSFAEEAQREVWRDGPDVALAGSVLPVCAVTPVDGGFRVSGRSPFTSGVDHSAWVHVAGMVPSSAGPPAWTSFLVPREQVEVADTWHTTAMCATGSRTVVTQDVFVPHARTLRFSDLIAGTGPGSDAHASRLYRLPFAAYGPLGFVATMLGAAQGAWQLLRARIAERTGPGGERAADSPFAQTGLARAAADLDAAELLLRRTIALTYADPAPDEGRRARSLRDFAHAAQLCVSAIDAVLALSGTAAFARDDAIGRAWRDVHFAAAHVSLNPDNANAHWGRLQLGLERAPATKIY